MKVARLRSLVLSIALVVVGAQCGGGGGDGPTVQPTPPVISVNAGNGQPATAGTAVATPPSVKVMNSSGSGVAGIAVSFAVTGGGGSATGISQTTNGSGIATVGGWTMGTTAGANTMTATAAGTTGGPVTFTITSTAGAATTIAVNAGNNQSVNVGSAVATAPSVKVTDAFSNPVAGTTVTFATGTGGGSVTGATQVTNASGIATVGSWTPGAAGTNTMTATATGLTGSPVTFTATATVPSAMTITSISPALLTPGISATITGSGFSTTAASNVVTIDGVTATVTAATATQVTFTVPIAMPCEATHDAVVSVAQSGTTPVTANKPLQVATLRTLAVGQSVIVTASGEQRCNELSNTGTSRYFVSVSNTNPVYSTNGATFQVRGSAGTGTSGLSPDAARVSLRQRLDDAARQRPVLRMMTPADLADQAHMRVLDANIKHLNENRGSFTGRQPGATRSIAVPVVGDQVSLNIPNIRNTAGSICQNPYPMTGRIVYVGTKSIIVEDNANPMAGTIDTTYTAIGTEFDNVMFPILQNNYGNPLAKDATTDNNGRIVMVFSRRVSDSFSGLAGFVVSCDFQARNTTSNTTSNFGEYFYATAPLVPGSSLSTQNSPPYWKWTMRGTIIHEVKHITSFAERISRNAPSEESWLEETTARLSEELYERSVYSLSQKANIGYGTSANPVGPYCGVRGCSGRPRGIIRVFEELAPKWYTSPEAYSPIGRIDENDFSFYATGWSLLRWAIDHSTMTESAFLQALTQDGSLRGVANLEARTGRTFPDMIPEWSLAMALDDHPSFTPAASTPASGRMNQPSWNFRSVFAGYKADFSNAAWAAWPFNPYSRTFGSFTVDGNVRPGTAAIIELSGTAGAKQLLELKSSGTANAPAELRIAIVRVQ